MLTPATYNQAGMSEIIEVQLKWVYTPKNYVEEPVHLEDENFKLTIADGVALAQIVTSSYAEKPDVEEVLTKKVGDRLSSIQIVSGGAFTLSTLGRTELKEDGSKNIYLKAEHKIPSISGSTDREFTDRDGNAFSSRQERLNEQQWFAEMIDK